MNKHSLTKRAASIAGLSAIAMMASALVACSGGSSDAEPDLNRIVIAADDGVEAHWGILKEKLKVQGIDLEVKTLTDGVQTNNGVKDGTYDVNLFQHLIFLAQYNVDNSADLVPVGATAVYPLALFSLDYASPEEIPDGTTVAIPNNPTNQARALLNLQAAGLIELRDGGNALSTPADITGGRVDVKPIDAEQTVQALKDGSAGASVVNNAQAQRGGLEGTDIIFKEDVNDPKLAPYINVFVTRAELKDDPRWPKLVAAYHSAEVEQSVTDLNDGNLLFQADWTAEDLTEVLDGLEEDIKNLK